MKFIITLLLSFLSLPLLSGAYKIYAQVSARPIPNPQLQMIGSRHIALGGTNPVIPSDLNGIMINPGVVGSLDPMPVAASHQSVMGEFEYNFLSASIPFEMLVPQDEKWVRQKFTAAFSYGNNALHDIPETLLDSNRVRQTGTFSAGFDVFSLAVGTELYDVAGFNSVQIGVSGKGVRQYIKDDSRMGYGLDVGGIATYHFNQYHIDKVHLGFSSINFLATPLRWEDTGDEAILPFEVFLGVGADLFDEQLSVYLHNAIEGVAVGAEYVLQDQLFLRGSTDFKRVNLGSGILFEQVTGFDKQDYSLRLDVAYTQNVAPLDNNPNFSLSLSVLGEARPRTPRILVPSEKVITQSRQIRLAGIGPKSTTIRVFNNDSLSRTVVSNKYGQWSLPSLPLKEGQNKIHVTAYSLEEDDSVKSDPLFVTSDTTPPKLELKIYPDGNVLKMIVVSEDDLKEINGVLGGEFEIPFRQVANSPVWQAQIPLPEDLRTRAIVPQEMKRLELSAVDQSGNETEPSEYLFFAEIEFPQDKLVNYKNEVRFIGTASNMVTRILVGDEPVYIDANQKFSISHPLKPGKNSVPVTIQTVNNKSLDYRLRVLRLVTFPDLTRDVLERREIEFLATLGIIDGDRDGFFYPDTPVTRRYLLKTMVKIGQYALEDVEDDLFPDVLRDDADAEYIQAGLVNGLMFAFPDGLFKPDQPLTLSEAVFLLTNAGLIEETPLTPTEGFLTRKALAQFLAYTPTYEVQIERLIDWNIGY